jgi:hypothetical protein
MARCKRGDLIMITKFESDLPAGRQRYLALGRHYAAAIAEIQVRGFEAALEAVDTMGGAAQRMTIARSLVVAASKLGEVPAYRVIDYPRRRGEDGAAVVDRMIEIPELTWEFRGRRQVGRIVWLPMLAVTDRGDAPAIQAALP